MPLRKDSHGIRLLSFSEVIVNTESESTTDRQFETHCVHAGEPLDDRGGMFPPLYNHSTFGFSSTEELKGVIGGKQEGNLYTRYGQNPTVRALEDKLADQALG